MKITTVKEEQIKKLFEKETGIPISEIEELSEAFPWSYFGTIKTLDKEFQFSFTYGGRAKKKSFIQQF